MVTASNTQIEAETITQTVTAIKTPIETEIITQKKLKLAFKQKLKVNKDELSFITQSGTGTVSTIAIELKLDYK